MSTGISVRIFDELRTAIITEKYPIGSKLPTERELAEQYAANRFAVREAIAMLSQNGFVETLPQSGTYVKDFFTDGSLDTLVQTLRIRRTIDRQTLQSLLKFRIALETAAASDAAAHITSEDIAYIEDILRRKAENPDDIAILTECDYEFHYKIICVSANIVSKLVFQSFRPMYSFFTSFFYSLPAAAETSLTLNRALLLALRLGDSDAAFRAMDAILRYGESTIFGAFDKREPYIVIPEEAGAMEGEAGRRQ